MTRFIILALVAMTGLTACGKGKGNPWGNREQFDGQYFRVKASGDRDARQNFVVTVNDARKTLAGARGAGIARANEYCIREFGRSDLTWDISPEVEDAQLPLVNGDLVLRGTCDGWR